MRLNLDAQTHPMAFWARHVPFLDAWIPSRPVFKPANPICPESSLFGRMDPIPPIFKPADPISPPKSSLFRHVLPCPFLPRYGTHRPFLAPNLPVFDLPTPPGHDASPFWMHCPILALIRPFSDARTSPCPFLPRF